MGGAQLLSLLSVQDVHLPGGGSAWQIASTYVQDEIPQLFSYITASISLKMYNYTCSQQAAAAYQASIGIIQLLIKAESLLDTQGNWWKQAANPGVDRQSDEQAPDGNCK